MTTPSLDSRIDALYALPLDAFTAARNALAKSLKGDAARVSRVKSLAKPTQVPWAVNLLYWNDRATWTRLLDAGRALRTAQLEALDGRASDVQGAHLAHRSALAAAAASAAKLATESGGAAPTDPLTRMLEALSLAPEPPSTPGRYVDVLHPAGFEALAGLSPGVSARVPAIATSAHTAPVPSAPQLDAAYRAAVATRERLAHALMRAEASLALADTQVAALRAQLERTETTRAAAQAAVADAARELAGAEAAEREARQRLRNV